MRAHPHSVHPELVEGPEVSKPRKLAAADHAWLRMDCAQNLVVIHLAFVFAAPLKLAAVRQRIESHLLTHHQFTHRIQRGWLAAWWMPDAAFHLDRHLRELTLGHGLGTTELKAWMSAQADQPLPADRPLWQATLVHGVDGGSALVMRVHHSLADGVSLMDLIGGMTEVAEGASVIAPARASSRQALSAGVLLHRAPKVLADTLTMLLMRRDAPSKLKGEPGRAKSVAWSAPLSLESVRELAHRHAATVNDAMLAVIAHVLRRHLQGMGQTRIYTPIRAVIPMNMRPSSEAHLLGNQFGLVGVDLPVHEPDPLDRLHAVRDGMSSLKRGFQGQLALLLVRVAGCLPLGLQRAVLGIFSRRCTVIVTNVIGPAEPRSVGGVRMDELMLCVPQGMTVGIGVSIISYAGSVRIGFLVDDKLMPDAAAAAAAVRSCFEQLCRAACASEEAEPAAPPLAPAPTPFWTRAVAFDTERGVR